MRYLLDTDWLIDGITQTREAVNLIARIAPHGVATSIISYIEAYEGVIGNHAAESAFDQLLAGLPVLPIDESVARRCAQVRHELRERGRRVNRRALDLIIAATALEYGMELVTRNVGDYADIPELTIYES